MASSSTDLGTLTMTPDGRYALTFERGLAHPPSKVWRALTEPAHLGEWFPAVVEFDLTPGAPLRFVPTPEQRRRLGLTDADSTHGEVTRVDPLHVLEYTWAGEVLRWELHPEGAGTCRLVFTHICDARDSAVAQGAGWHAALEVLEALLDGRPVDWSAWDRAAEMADTYARAV